MCATHFDNLMLNHSGHKLPFIQIVDVFNPLPLTLPVSFNVLLLFLFVNDEATSAFKQFHLSIKKCTDQPDTKQLLLLLFAVNRVGKIIYK